MAVLRQNVPVSSSRPELLVENRLKAGTYRFQLVVVDDSGNESRPALLALRVAPAGGGIPGPGGPGVIGGIGGILRDVLPTPVLRDIIDIVTPGPKPHPPQPGPPPGPVKPN